MEKNFLADYNKIGMFLVNSKKNYLNAESNIFYSSVLHGSSKTIFISALTNSKDQISTVPSR